MFSESPNFEKTIKIIHAIVEFENKSAINLACNMPFKSFTLDSEFNVIGWENAGFPENIFDFYEDPPVKYLFRVSSDQKLFLENSLEIYAGSTMNHKLRKIIEVCTSRELKFKVKLANREGIPTNA